MEETTKNAVEVMHATKRYSSRQVLRNFSMSVPEGTIYGLLGPSGCGKTTLLQALVGNIKLDSGSITLSTPNRSEIGYMPQEITLFPNMSIEEHLNYYGLLYGMKSFDIRRRADELTEFLQLPALSSITKEMSGGQQRRVSLCITLLHDPKLLILDEPTVGVDVILAHNIWEKLLHMSKFERKTVIITTHYIEDARRSNTIGLMRNGVLLAENDPNKLMEEQECENLEQCFLKLCKTEKNDQEIFGIEKSEEEQFPKPEPHLTQTTSLKLHRVSAHILKNIYWMKRNVPMMLFTFALPIIQCYLASTTLGEKPQGISIGLVNDEIRDKGIDCGANHWIRGLNCSQPDIPFSCYITNKFLNKSINVHLYDSLIEAELSVKKNYNWAMVHFNDKFSSSLSERMKSLELKDNNILNFSQMNVWMDETNLIISSSLKHDIITSLLEFIHDVGDHCNWPTSAVLLPVKLEKPVFGVWNPNYRQSMTPGNAILFEFYFAILFTVSVLIDEKTSGLLDRSMIAGLSLVEIALGHIVMQYFVLVIQTLIEWLILFQFFDNPVLSGSFFPCFFLLMLVGTCGIFYGFAIVSHSNSFTSAAVTTFGSYFPIFMLSGTLWPVEGMHYILRTIAVYLPVTRCVEAFRSISVRGWSLTHPTVYSSVITVLCWSAVYILISIVYVKGIIKNIRQ